MHLLTFLYALPLTGAAIGQITSPSAGATYQAASTFTIQCQGGGSPLTIVLETGVPEIPASGTTIASMCEKSSQSIPVEYNVPFLSFVVSFVLNASRLRRTLIKPSLCNLFQRQLLKYPYSCRIDRLISTYNSIYSNS
jgi:hypothetical protein